MKRPCLKWILKSVCTSVSRISSPNSMERKIYVRTRVLRTPGPSASAMTFSGSTGVQLRKIEHVRGARRRIDLDSIRIESWRPSLNVGWNTACGSFSRFVRIILMEARSDLTACCRMTLGVRVRSRARPWSPATETKRRTNNPSSSLVGVVQVGWCHRFCST